MRVLDKTIVTEDEGFEIAGTVADAVRTWLEELKIDSYNEQYSIRVTVDRIDDLLRKQDEPIEEVEAAGEPEEVEHKSVPSQEELRQKLELMRKVVRR